MPAALLPNRNGPPPPEAFSRKNTPKIIYSFPPESLVIHRASVIIFDYHDTVYNGHLSADNRNPNEDDLDLFTKIIITILYEYGLVGEFDDFDELYNRIKLDLKKRVEESDRYEKRN